MKPRFVTLHSSTHAGLDALMSNQKYDKYDVKHWQTTSPRANFYALMELRGNSPLPSSATLDITTVDATLSTPASTD